MKRGLAGAADEGGNERLAGPGLMSRNLDAVTRCRLLWLGSTRKCGVPGGATVRRCQCGIARPRPGGPRLSVGARRALRGGGSGGSGQGGGLRDRDFSIDSTGAAAPSALPVGGEQPGRRGGLRHRMRKERRRGATRAVVLGRGAAGGSAPAAAAAAATAIAAISTNAEHTGSLPLHSRPSRANPGAGSVSAPPPRHLAAAPLPPRCRPAAARPPRRPASNPASEQLPTPFRVKAASAWRVNRDRRTVTAAGAARRRRPCPRQRPREAARMGVGGLVGVGGDVRQPVPHHTEALVGVARDEGVLQQVLGRRPRRLVLD